LLNSQKIIRAFVALPIPATVIAQLSKIQDSLKPKFREVSWTRPESMHLTLRFLGDIDSARVDNIIAALAAATIGINSFAVQLGEIGAFGSRVIWLVCARARSHCADLKQRFAQPRRNFGIQEKRDFNAHVTLGRFRKPDAMLQQNCVDARGSIFPPGRQRTLNLFAANFRRTALATRCWGRFPLSTAGPQTKRQN
jgi:2'-5' RNA ligase